MESPQRQAGGGSSPEQPRIQFPRSNLTVVISSRPSPLVTPTVMPEFITGSEPYLPVAPQVIATNIPMDTDMDKAKALLYPPMSKDIFPEGVRVIEVQGCTQRIDTDAAPSDTVDPAAGYVDFNQAKILILLVPQDKREELALALQEGDMLIVSLMASGTDTATEGFSYWDYEEWMKQQREQALKDAMETPAAMPTAVPAFTQKKPKAPEPATGAAGKSAESAINRWRSMMDTFEKEIAKASDNSIAQIDAWSTKFYNDLMQIVAKGEGLISQEEMWQGIIKLNQAVTGKLTHLWEDYTKWYAQNTNNRLEALKMEEREITQKYTDMKNKLGEYQAALAKMPATPPPGVTEATWKEARTALIKKIEGIKKFEESGIKIPVVFETKNIKEFQNLVQNADNAYKEQWSALQGIIPDMAQQAKVEPDHPEG